MKAKYIGFFCYENDRYNSPTYEYEYKGYRYTVTNHRNGYSESMKSQHEWEQDRIDKIIKERVTNENREAHTFNADEIYEMMGWDE